MERREEEGRILGNERRIRGKKERERRDGEEGDGKKTGRKRVVREGSG